jgi:hypothetical protein
MVSEHFLTCGDYRQGIARIRCSNPDCGHDYYFRPFFCKWFYLCPRTQRFLRDRKQSLHGRAWRAFLALLRYALCMSAANDQPEMRIRNESDSNNSGTGGNRAHFTASGMPGRAGAKGSDQARKTGRSPPGFDPASLN